MSDRLVISISLFIISGQLSCSFIYLFIYAFLLLLFIYLFIFTLQYYIGFAIHQHESAMGVHVVPGSHSSTFLFYLTLSVSMNLGEIVIDCGLEGMFLYENFSM